MLGRVKHTPVPMRIAAGVLALDQVGKVLAMSLLPPDQLFLNTGAAFGLLPGWRWPLAALGVLSAPLLYWAARAMESGPLAAWSAGLLAGGTAANTLDRLVRGAVVDFLFLPGYPFRFNAADVALRLGAVLILWSTFRVRKGVRGPRQPNRQADPAAIHIQGE